MLGSRLRATRETWPAIGSPGKDRKSTRAGSPTPALVAPIEFTLRRADYAALGGHVGEIRDLEDVLAKATPAGLRTERAA